MFYRQALRPLLFRQDPETAHERTLKLLAEICAALPPAARRPVTHTRLKVRLAGLDFPNPVGLAAGCDKNGSAVDAWPHFGFGFVEIGTVTAQAQPGNPKPRMFRVPEQSALVNRLGFNSEGSEAVAKRLAHLRGKGYRRTVPLGINIGKTKQVSGDEATLDDYRTAFRRLSRWADFVVVNVSSPNTPGLRQWQERGRLTALLGMLRHEARAAAPPPSFPTALKPQGATTQEVPLFVKISPDMTDADMDAVAEVALELNMAGIIATNTTLAREGAACGLEMSGGLSGKPLRDRATAVIRYLYRRTQGRIPLIGVGGIFGAEDAYARIQAGASLVQLYTSLVYEGPYLPRRISAGLLRLMERDGIAHIAEAIGVHA